MKTRQYRHYQPTVTHGQCGFSLVELMVALTIGATLMFGVIQVFSSNRETYNIQEGLGQLQENGQFALNLFSRQVRQAGFYPNPYGEEPGNKITHEQLAFGGTAPVSGTEGTGSINDDITLAYYTAKTDCIGDPPDGGAIPAQAVSATNLSGPGTPTAIAINTINIAPGASGRPSLFCNNVEVAEGVEYLQILYGEDTDDDGIVDNYSDINNVTLTNIKIVQVAMLVASIREVRHEKDTKTYDLLGVIVDPVDDRRYRRVYSTSIKLHNRCTSLNVTAGSKPCA